MKTFFLSIAVLLSGYVFSQNPEQGVSKTLAENDSLFWAGYNTCNLELMSQFLTTDLEFYHDKGGITLGIDGMTKAMRDNICKDSQNKVRRELAAGTFKLFLLKNSDTIYGAISGEHYFYNTHADGKETKDGVATFTNLWVLREGKWKMNRIFSFDHKGLN